MYVESEIGKLARYSDNAIEAFRIAVDNGQARLAMQILVDVIDAYADKFDEYDALIEEKLNSVKPENSEITKEESMVDIKEEPIAEVKAQEEVKPVENKSNTAQTKAKPMPKEVITDK